MGKTLVGDAVEIYALIGPSGTGKSTSSLFFAHEKKIPAIIDDGLLIYKGKRVAGTSAKFEKNYITAVKRATFHLKEHRQDVQQTIRNYKIKKLLIIGTSKRMVDKIAAALELGKISHYVDVTEIRSSSEIKMALYVRQTEGKHVIPIPYIQVEQSFFKKLVSKGKQLFTKKSEYVGETTIVHPDFTRGTIHISDKIFNLIVEKEVEKMPDFKECRHVSIQMFGLPTIQVHVHLNYPMQRPIQEIGRELQQNIINAFHDYLELEVDKIQINVEK